MTFTPQNGTKARERFSAGNLERLTAKKQIVASFLSRVCFEPATTLHGHKQEKTNSTVFFKDFCIVIEKYDTWKGAPYNLNRILARNKNSKRQF